MEAQGPGSVPLEAQPPLPPPPDLCEPRAQCRLAKHTPADLQEARYSSGLQVVI